MQVTDIPQAWSAIWDTLEHPCYLYACKTQELPDVHSFSKQQLEASQNTADICFPTADFHPCASNTPHLEPSQEESCPNMITLWYKQLQALTFAVQLMMEDMDAFGLFLKCCLKKKIQTSKREHFLLISFYLKIISWLHLQLNKILSLWSKINELFPADLV